MKASDIFGLLVRTMSFSILLWGGSYVFGESLWAVGLMRDAYDAPADDGQARDRLVYGLACVIVGFGLLRSASWFVSFSYPGDGNSSERSISESKQS